VDLRLIDLAHHAAAAHCRSRIHSASSIISAGRTPSEAAANARTLVRAEPRSGNNLDQALF
jgi:hypothetical protein